MKYIILLFLIIFCFSCTIVTIDEQDNKIDITSYPVPKYNIDLSNDSFNFITNLKNTVNTYYKHSSSSLVEILSYSVRNFITYKLDIDSQEVDNYWQTPLQTLTLGTGDCEDMSILFMYILVEYLKIDKNLITLVAAEVPGKGWHAYVHYVDNESLLKIKKDRWLDVGEELDTNNIIYTYDQALKIAEYTHDPDKVK